jgi:hypothetical protein
MVETRIGNIQFRHEIPACGVQISLGFQDVAGGGKRPRDVGGGPTRGVPLPLGPTEIAALATPVMPTIRKARTEAIFFMARNRKENTGWRKTLLLRADPGMKRELQFVHP